MSNTLRLLSSLHLLKKVTSYLNYQYIYILNIALQHENEPTKELIQCPTCFFFDQNDLTLFSYCLENKRVEHFYCFNIHKDCLNFNYIFGDKNCFLEVAIFEEKYKIIKWLISTKKYSNNFQKKKITEYLKDGKWNNMINFLTNIGFCHE